MLRLKPTITCRLQFYVWICFLYVQLSSLPGYSQGVPSKEEQVKAAYIFNFATFTTWPESAFSSSESPVVIGIVGDDPFGIFLDEIVSGEKKDRVIRL